MIKKSMTWAKQIENNRHNCSFLTYSSMFTDSCFHMGPMYCRELQYDTHSSWVRAFAFSNDGNFFASSGDHEESLLWPIGKMFESQKNPTPIILPNTEGQGVTSLAFSPNSLRVFSGDVSGISIHDVKT